MYQLKTSFDECVCLTPSPYTNRAIKNLIHLYEVLKYYVIT